MITNSKVTIYHKKFDKILKIEKWARNNYNNVWIFKNKGSNVNQGYENNNSIDIRIPYATNNISDKEISIGDIIVVGEVLDSIETQQDLKKYDVYNITSINNNEFGNNPHIHIRGK